MNVVILTVMNVFQMIRCLNHARKLDIFQTNNIRCLKRVILVVTTDCEEGNKQMLLKLKGDSIDARLDPYLPHLLSMPDVSHIGKSLKASLD